MSLLWEEVVILLVHLAIEQACPDNKFLDEMARVVPWELFEREVKAEIKHKTGGRRPYCRL